MFGFFKRKPATPSVPVALPEGDTSTAEASPAVVSPVAAPVVVEAAPVRSIVPQIQAEPEIRAGWFSRLKSGLSRTGSNISSAFSRVKIDEQLYEELETALLTSDAGVATTEFVLTTLRERVRRDRLTEPMQVRDALKPHRGEIFEP